MSKQPPDDPTQEAIILSQYLISKNPSSQQIDLYQTATIARPSDRAFERTFRHPRLLPYIDAYDALCRPHSELRSRLYLMFSILEASTKNTDLFLPRQRQPWFILTLPLIGLRAGWRLLVGALLVKAGGY